VESKSRIRKEKEARTNQKERRHKTKEEHGKKGLVQTSAKRRVQQPVARQTKSEQALQAVIAWV
jgi:hypothetical protein